MRLLMACPEIDIEFALKAPVPAMIVMRPDGTATMRVRSTLPPLALAWGVFHELGEWLLARATCTSEFIEQYADNVAATLIAPVPAMRRLRHAYGFDLPRVATALRTSQTIAALRWGEVFDEPLAVVMPTRVKRRGPLTLPGDGELRRIVRAGGCEGGLVWTLDDARGRSVVRSVEF